jgi:RimJ/RimL family protein N-acetyltransferase
MARMNVVPVTLRGSVVRLEPLSLAHVPALSAVGLEPEIWRWNPALVSTAEEMRAYVEVALEDRRRGVSEPFATVEQATGKVIGSTRYMSIDAKNRRLEIGATWLAPAHQRTGANTEAKLLLLTHAFEELGAIRVELKTDALNEVSRRAIVRIGAIEEGTFRRHMIIPRSGRVRDTVYFSIIDAEWPATKAKLAARLRA